MSAQLDQIEHKVEIYALLDPVTSAIRYIGKANNAQERLKVHMREKRRDYPVYRWIAKLVREGKTPSLAIVATCDRSNWQQVERNAISAAKAQGYQLLNIAPGGDEPHCPTETRANNGRLNSVRRTATPAKARTYKTKQAMGQNLRFLRNNGSKEVYNQVLTKLHAAATKRPDLFGEYLTLHAMQ